MLDKLQIEERQKQREAIAKRVIKKLGEKRQSFIFKLLLVLQPSMSARTAKMHAQNIELLDDNGKTLFFINAIFPPLMSRADMFDRTLREVDHMCAKSVESKIRQLR